MGKRHQDDVRSKIQASHILRRFMGAFEGEIELTSDQINIGKCLLNKVLPDLKAIEHSSDPDNPLTIVSKIERVIVNTKD